MSTITYICDINAAGVGKHLSSVMIKTLHRIDQAMQPKCPMPVHLRPEILLLPALASTHVDCISQQAWPCKSLECRLHIMHTLHMVNIVSMTFTFSLWGLSLQDSASLDQDTIDFCLIRHIHAWLSCNLESNHACMYTFIDKKHVNPTWHHLQVLIKLGRHLGEAAHFSCGTSQPSPAGQGTGRLC